MKKHLILLADLLVSDNDFALEFSSKENVDEKFKLVKAKFNNFDKEDFLEFLDILESLEKTNKKLSLKELESISGGVGNNKIKLAALTFLGLTLLPMVTSGIASAQLPEFYTNHTLELTPEETKKADAYSQFLNLIKTNNVDDVLSKYKNLVDSGSLSADSEIIKDGNFNPEHPAVKAVAAIKAVNADKEKTFIDAFNTSEFGRPFFEAYEETKKADAYSQFLNLIKTNNVDNVLSKYKNLVDSGDLPVDPDIIKDDSFNPEHPAVKAVASIKAINDVLNIKDTVINAFNSSEFGRPFFEACDGFKKARAYPQFLNLIKTNHIDDILSRYKSLVENNELFADPKLMDGEQYNPEHPAFKAVTALKAVTDNNPINAFNSSEFGKPYFEAYNVTAEEAKNIAEKAKAYKSFLTGMEKNDVDSILQRYEYLIRHKILPADLKLMDGDQYNPEHPAVRFVADMKATINNMGPINTFNSSEFGKPYFEAYNVTAEEAKNRAEKANAYKSFLKAIKKNNFDAILMTYNHLVHDHKLPNDDPLWDSKKLKPSHPAVKVVTALKAVTDNNAINAFNSSEFGKPYFEAYKRRAKISAQRAYYKEIYSEIRKVIDNDSAINRIFGKKQKLVIEDNGCTYTLSRAAFQHIIYGTYDSELAFHKSGGHTEKALDLMKRINLAKLDPDAEKNPLRDEYISNVLKVDKSKALEPSKAPFYDDVIRVIRGKRSVLHGYHFLDSSDAVSSLPTGIDVARKNFFPKEWDEREIWEKIQYCVLNGKGSEGMTLVRDATIKYNIKGIDYTMKMRVVLSNSNEILTAYPLSITQE